MIKFYRKFGLLKMNIRIFLSLFVILFNISCHSKTNSNFSEGLTIDPNIEKLIKKQKKINEFSVSFLRNDTIDNEPITKGVFGLPLTPIIQAAENDTALVFLNMLALNGFKINLKKDSNHVEYFLSSKSCECFKNELTDPGLSYGASTKPTNFTLVLNKASNFKQDEMIFGYIRMSGGHFYRLRSGNSFDKISYLYEGYFKVKFQPLIIK